MALLLALLPVVVGAQSESSTQRQRVPDTRMSGYWVDPSTGLMWVGRDNFDRDLNWHRAMKYCHDLQLAGYADWRLPEIGELEGLYDTSANALGLAGKRNERGATWHVKGDIFLTGPSWSATRRRDDRGRPAGSALTFRFSDGFRDLYELRVGRRALCVRGDVTVDLALPGLSRIEAARQVGVDYTARRYFDVDNRVAARLEYWSVRIGCEDGVVTRVTWLDAERNCRRWVELTAHLVGDALLDRVYALGLLGVSLASEKRPTDSLLLLERALAMRRERYEDDADAADFQVIAAQVQMAMGNTAAATAFFESAIATYEQAIARASTPQDQYRHRLAAIRKQFAALKLRD